MFSDIIFRGERSSAVSDTNWDVYSAVISDIDSSDCPCDIFVYAKDSWYSDWNQRFYLDNVSVNATGSMTRSGNVSMIPNSLSVDDFLGMQSSNSTVIHTVNVFSDAIKLDWDSTAKQYKVVIANSDTPREKTADIVIKDNTYTFVNLEPDTSYDIRAGIRGDDSTQSVLSFTTLPSGVMLYDSKIYLNSQLHDDDDDTVTLSWLDLNDIGENRYRVERSVDGGDYELTGLAPISDTRIVDVLEPDWDTVSYKVFERLGQQKLYSNEMTMNIP